MQGEVSCLTPPWARQAEGVLRRFEQGSRKDNPPFRARRFSYEVRLTTKGVSCDLEESRRLQSFLAQPNENSEDSGKAKLVDTDCFAQICIVIELSQ